MDTTSRVKIVRSLPPEAKDGELVSIDLEIYGIPKGKLHRPVGTFACCSVMLERDLDTGTVYQFYDPLDLSEFVERVDRGKWVFQNGMFDIRQMRRWATIEPRPIWDTKIVDQGLWGGYYSTFDLGSLSLRYLHEYLPKDVREEFSTATKMDEAMQDYAAVDPWVTLRVALEQIAYIDDNDLSMDHYWKADEPAVWAILDMLPAKMDTEGWSALSVQFCEKAQAVKVKYPDLNLGSPVQINAQLVKMLGRKNKLPSTDEESLLAIMDEAGAQGKDKVVHFCEDVLAYRKAAKMESTYGQTWLDKHVEAGGLVYAGWKPVQALTGRMACGEPNLQNIPSREFPIFRTFFVAGREEVIIVADVSSQEPRIMAKLSGDELLTRILLSGLSPHVGVGQELFVDPDFSKKSVRYPVAKQLNLGLSYGMTASGLAVRAGISVDEAEGFVQLYFSKFPKVKAYIDRYREFAGRKGYVETLLGRRSWINPYVRKWENNAINSPIQGSGSDQMKIAMGFMHREARTRGLPFALSMVVHDEMVLRSPEECKQAEIQLMEDAWQEAGRLTLGDTIPMRIEVESGSNWGCKGG